MLPIGNFELFLLYLIGVKFRPGLFCDQRSLWVLQKHIYEHQFWVQIESLWKACMVFFSGPHIFSHING